MNSLTIGSPKNPNPNVISHVPAFEKPLDPVQFAGKKFSPVPSISIESTKLKKIGLKIAIINSYNNTVLEKAIVVTGAPEVTKKNIAFPNIRLASDLKNSQGNRYCLRIEIGGFTVDSTPFVIQASL